MTHNFDKRGHMATARTIGVRVFLYASVYLMAACGGSSGAPTAPTPPLPIVPTLSGQWTGNYTVTSCTESGAAAGSNFCANLGRGGAHNFTPQQSGSNLTGTLSFGQFLINVSGNVGADHVVALGGTGDIVGALLTLTSWRATVSGSTMTGTMTFSLTTANPVGSANVSATTSLTR